MRKFEKKKVLTKAAAVAMAASLTLGSSGTEVFAQQVSHATNHIGNATVTVDLWLNTEWANVSISTNAPNTYTHVGATVYYKKSQKYYRHSSTAVGTLSGGNSVTASAQKQRYAAIVKGGRGRYSAKNNAAKWKNEPILETGTIPAKSTKE